MNQRNEKKLEKNIDIVLISKLFFNKLEINNNSLIVTRK